MMGELGIMGEVIERCLNHVEQNKLKRICQRHELKHEQQAAWRLLGERLTGLLSPINNLYQDHQLIYQKQSLLDQPFPRSAY